MAVGVARVVELPEWCQISSKVEEDKQEGWSLISSAERAWLAEAQLVRPGRGAIKACRSYLRC